MRRVERVVSPPAFDVESEFARLDAEIGARVQGLRTQRGYSPTQLGDCIAASRQQIEAYERGDDPIPVSCLIRIARALDCPLGDLLKAG
jgi:transcriptional regulator with XRE-family HTH domain